MAWIRLFVLSSLVALLAFAEADAAGPPGNKGKGGREMTFKGVITDINQGKNNRDEAGSITVRGHDERGGKGKGKGRGQAGKGGGAARETETFRVGDKTLIIRANTGGPGGKGKGGAGGKERAGGKGAFGGAMLTIRQLREGDLVEVHHAGHFATEVRVLGHLGGPGDAKGKGKGKG